MAMSGIEIIRAIHPTKRVFQYGFRTKLERVCSQEQNGKLSYLHVMPKVGRGDGYGQISHAGLAL